jgi:hypothetical protein
MVPAFAREHEGFDVSTVAIETQDSTEPSPRAAVGTFATSDVTQEARAAAHALESLEANARRPRMDLAREGHPCLDVSSHSSRT